MRIAGEERLSEMKSNVDDGVVDFILIFDLNLRLRKRQKQNQEGKCYNLRPDS